VYSGTWTAYSGGGGPYGGTLHWSSVVGQYVEFTFSGQGVTLVYTGYPNRGVMGIAINGTPVASLNQYASSPQWQRQWTYGGSLSPGTHTLRLTHASGPYVDVDAIIIAGPPTAWIDPPDKTVYLNGGTFTVDVAITDVVNLGGFEFTLAFSPTIVHVEGVELGGFLGSTGRNASPLGPQIDNQAGTVLFGGFSYGASLGPGGSGVLATISFSPQTGGESDLHLQNVQAMNTVPEVIPLELQDGHVTVVE